MKHKMLAIPCVLNTACVSLTTLLLKENIMWLVLIHALSLIKELSKHSGVVSEVSKVVDKSLKTIYNWHVYVSINILFFDHLLMQAFMT